MLHVFLICHNHLDYVQITVKNMVKEKNRIRKYKKKSTIFFTSDFLPERLMYDLPSLNH